MKQNQTITAASRASENVSGMLYSKENDEFSEEIQVSS
jgi:hypothetical protein